MENKKETDVGITIQTWDETQKCAAEFKKLLRILTARIKNLEETRFSEELRATIDQELNCFSERITDTAAQLNEIPHLVAELQNTMLKFNLTNQLPHIRRERGRALIPATDSGFDSTTYSGTSKIINSGIIPSTNRPFDDETYSDTTQDITNSDKNIKAPG
ncbi:uncharacterized protein LOC134687706 [Mytilus trossulus]|uniref:uncharacterized protein LOC134687706 n=1 Tax=Mytilus trossulus TaxID=6551 RepID=UPI0030064721